MKKILCLALTIAMVLSFGNLVYADETVETAGFTLSTGLEVQATVLEADATCLTEDNGADGWYYVTGNLDVDHDIEIDGNIGVILDEAAVLTFTDAVADGFIIPSGASLTIEQCGSSAQITNQNGEGSLACAKGDLYLIGVTMNAVGCCVYADDNGYVCISDSTLNSAGSDKFAVDLNGNCTADIESGSISGDGGLYTNCANCTMSGGTISGQTVGVCNDAGFNMVGGQIINSFTAVENHAAMGIGGSARVWAEAQDGNTHTVLLNGGTFTIAEDPQDEMCIGVYVSDFDGSDIVIMSDADASYIDYFGLDDTDNQKLYFNEEDGTLYIGAPDAAEDETTPEATASVFSSSTALVIVGAVVIIAVIAVMVAKKKKTAK